MLSSLIELIYAWFMPNLCSIYAFTGVLKQLFWGSSNNCFEWLWGNFRSEPCTRPTKHKSSFRAVLSLSFLLGTATCAHPHYSLRQSLSPPKKWWQWIVTIVYDVRPPPTNHKGSLRAALSFFLSRYRRLCTPPLPSPLPTTPNEMMTVSDHYHIRRAPH